MSSEPPGAPAPKPRPKWLVYLARVGAGSLAVSIVIHVVFIVIATLYVVSVVNEQRKVAFTGGGAGDGTGGAAAETRHQVSVARQNTTPVPSALSQKLVVEGASSVALPELPALGVASSAVSSSTGAAGSLGGGLGTGAGTGSGAGPGTGALRMMPFGLLQAPKSGALTGTLYLMPSEHYKTNQEEFQAFEKWMRSVNASGWSESHFTALLKSPKQLFATQILIPKVTASEAPKAFGVAAQDSLVRFFIRYRGKVSPPRSGTWRFVGYGDDTMIIRINGKVVLEAAAPFERKKTGPTGWSRRNFHVYPGGKYTIGDWVYLSDTTAYEMEVCLSEEPREGDTSAILLVEEQGGSYEKTASGAPILPPWTLAPDPAVAAGKLGVPVLSKGAPVWISRGQ